jgi:hypothetical protein
LKIVAISSLCFGAIGIGLGVTAFFFPSQKSDSSKEAPNTPIIEEAPTIELKKETNIMRWEGGFEEDGKDVDSGEPYQAGYQNIEITAIFSKPGTT